MNSNMRPFIFVDIDTIDIRSKVFIKRLNELAMSGARVQYITTEKEPFIPSFLPRTNKDDICIYDIPFISLITNILIDCCNMLKTNIDFFNNGILITDDNTKAKSAELVGFRKIINSRFEKICQLIIK